MLLGLAIRNIVLVDRLDLSLRPGLNVFTGETGAGKSILLDALGLALGRRGDRALVRHGAGRASVSAEFEVPAGHPARRLLEEHGLGGGEVVVLRRVLDDQGRSRAYLDDQPVSVNLLRSVGETLVEIHGPGDHTALLDAAGHRALLDAFGGLEGQDAAVGEAWTRLSEAAQAVEAAAAGLAAARAEEDYLRHVAGELEALRPEPGEEQALAEARALLVHAEKLGEAVAKAGAALEGEGSAPERLRAAERALEKVAGHAAGRLDGALGALARASAEAIEAAAEVEAVRRALALEPERLEQVEERLFGLRAAARKHGVAVDALADLGREMAEKLAALDDGADQVRRLGEQAAEMRSAYAAAARELGAARRRAAAELDAALSVELAPIKLDKARFETRVEALDEGEWTRHGVDRVSFQVATNPGTPLGALARIASGGELSRLLLALKVVLAHARSASTLVFDEVDRGVGGATAHAVGERLSRLAANAQVLVVTHSPQVAARTDHHWRVTKVENGAALTRAEELDAEGRREEIARMLAGAEVTVEARAAADSLLQGRGA
ncbi:MAG: DNA repair protein RecN [Alphaproteobacteria bacterium]